LQADATGGRYRRTLQADGTGGRYRWLQHAVMMTVYPCVVRKRDKWEAVMASRADRQLSPQGTGRSIVGAAGEETADEVWVCRSARLSRPAYRFYRAILLTFLEKDDPPDLAALRQLARRHHVPLAATLARMAAQDLVQCDPRTGITRAAY